MLRKRDILVRWDNNAMKSLTKDKKNGQWHRATRESIRVEAGRITLKKIRCCERVIS